LPPFETTSWIDLASLRDPALVPDRVASVLAVRDAGRSLSAALTAAIGNRALLLILDNCEHVLASTAALVAELLATCPRLAVVATSRERLRLRGERELSVKPLAVPPREDGSGSGGPSELGQRAPVAGIAGVAAVRLFVERAVEAVPGFTLTPSNADAVADLCRRLDGLPLAIELAAAGVGVLPPAAVLARLERRLPLLSGGARDLPARQRTMRDAIAWSYDLLSEEEQVLFQCLTVFAGGCDLHGAEAVCGADAAARAVPAFGRDAINVIEGIASLVDKNLLWRFEADAAAGTGPRFMMLETVREFGLERLEATGEAATTRNRHAAWCLDLAEQMWRATARGPIRSDWIDRLAAEQDNLRAALGWLEQDDDATRFVQLAGDLWALWLYRYHALEGGTWLNRALARGGVPDPVRARALEAAANVAWFLGDVERMAELHGEQLSLARSMADDVGVGSGLCGLGDVALFRGDFARAAALLTEAYDLFQEQDHAALTAFTMYRLGVVAFAQGDLDRAAIIQEEAIAQYRALDDPWGTAMALDALGAVARDRGDLAGAAARYRSSLAFWIESGPEEGLAFWLTGVAVLAAAGGRPAQAARLFGAADSLREAPPAPLRPPWRERRDQAIAPVRADLGDAAFDEARTAGQALNAEPATSEAMALLAMLGDESWSPAPRSSVSR
jgi:non-specific serine/threonine protein kinase